MGLTYQDSACDQDLNLKPYFFDKKKRIYPFFSTTNSKLTRIPCESEEKILHKGEKNNTVRVWNSVRQEEESSLFFNP